MASDDVREILDDTMISGQSAKVRGLIDHLIDQDGLRDLIAKELRGSSKGKEKKIEIVNNYGKPQHEEVDFSNPFSLFASMAQQRQPESGKPQIALIYISGVITDGESGSGMFGGDFVGSEDIRKALRQAAKDQDIKAVVFRIDSPGGSALASEVIWQAARRVAEKKPLIVSVGSMAASGGYYIASSSERIFADPAAILGSIGVVGGKFVYGELLDRLGVNTESFSRGRNANLFSSTQPFTERQRKLVTTWMKQTYEQFTQRVMTTRKEKIKQIDDVARGRIFAAKQAKEVGLVDEIGGLHQALAYAAEKAKLKPEEYDVRILPAPKTLADLFHGGDTDAQTPLRPAVSVVPDSLLKLMDRATQRTVGQQLQALQLLQRHPVLLVTPYVVTIK
jgi:protease-4